MFTTTSIYSDCWYHHLLLGVCPGVVQLGESLEVSLGDGGPHWNVGQHRVMMLVGGSSSSSGRGHDSSRPHGVHNAVDHSEASIRGCWHCWHHSSLLGHAVRSLF